MTCLNTITFIIILQSFVGLKCSNVMKSNGTAGKDLDAQMLIALGRKMNKPLLTIIGKAIENHHLCTTWSKWTTCGATSIDFFSTRNRTRKCALDRSRNYGIPEAQTGVCEGICPAEYNMTADGFCMKHYTTKKSRDDAVRVCKDDGAFLVNIDSDSKYEVVKTILVANDEKQSLHIDGRRKNSTSQWEYTYGSRSDFFHWYSGYLNTGANNLCLMLTGYRTVTNQQFLWFNNPCSSAYAFICEVPT
ncbi:snaclec stejaggregin-A subunit alpha-like [Mercenaria mercenaria]|uniref:snaclec stejaggregin-A subunit alpha-like n=1 Tax=Mercenaria mercenaria TaxID=6596 RepID=UPI00234E9217|nr:snaclec stejaggregin-A subunit alpha-like [Mercenaria mercenaria]